MAEEAEIIAEATRRFERCRDEVAMFGILREIDPPVSAPQDPPGIPGHPHPRDLCERLTQREKSLEILKLWLSPEQVEDYETTSSFKVRGCHTGTTYRLSSTIAYNIKPLDQEHMHSATAYCVVPNGGLAIGDQLLAQKIWLETDEFATLMKANRRLKDE